jgi:very-short-patch-repair endonuclease
MTKDLSEVTKQRIVGDIRTEFLDLVQQDIEGYYITFEQLCKWVYGDTEFYDDYKNNTDTRKNYLKRYLRNPEYGLMESKDENDTDKHFIMRRKGRNPEFPFFSTKGFKTFCIFMTTPKTILVRQYYINLENEFIKAIRSSKEENDKTYEELEKSKFETKFLDEEITFDNYNIHVFGESNDLYFKAKDISSIFYEKNYSYMIKKYAKDNALKFIDLATKINYINLEEVKKSTKREQNIYYINKDGLFSIMNHIKKPGIDKFIKFISSYCNVNYKIINSIPKNRDCINTIMTAFKHKEPKLEYSINKYRIDIYFPNEKIAIECDENGHKDRDPKYEKEREDFIIKELECKMLRFNPDDDNFCIHEFINSIIIECEKNEVKLPKLL